MYPSPSERALEFVLSISLVDTAEGDVGICVELARSPFLSFPLLGNTVAQRNNLCLFKALIHLSIPVY